MNSILERSWYHSLPPDQKEMIELSIILYQRELESHSKLSDYSFIIFPAAKAYEGFLKQYLLDFGLISQTTYEGRKFRIGRALNPDVREDQRDEFWLFDDLIQLCGEPVARALWETWLECRNRVFHYFPNKNQHLTLETINKQLELLDETITAAHECKLESASGYNPPAVKQL